MLICCSSSVLQHLLNLAGEILNLMVQSHVQRWSHILLMLEFTCLRTLKNLTWYVFGMVNASYIASQCCVEVREGKSTDFLILFKNQGTLSYLKTKRIY